VSRLAVVLAALLLGGCESMQYYAQAIGGHLDVVRAARPLETWLADPGTPQDLRNRLELARRIREFASRELSLPRNGSFGAYAELGRPYVVWNVYAAPEFSTEAKKECFPFAGCVIYRGFFGEDDALRHAEKLRASGFDVFVGGVPAYSTLGWFDDPLLSTYIRYPDVQLARLLFHELAHQEAYAKGDSTFNESFAVAVEEEGVRRWLRTQGREAEFAAFHAAQARRRQLAARVDAMRKRLEGLYQSDVPADEKRRIKAQEFAALRADYGRLVPEAPSNAFLVSIAAYTELVPAFERLLAEVGGDLPAFYRRVRELAAADKKARDLALSARSSRGPS
jgi:predicted aminopeptidase